MGQSRRCAGKALAIDVRTWDARSDFGRLAGAIALRFDHIEDAVKAGVELVDVAIGENMGFGNRYVPPVVGNVLIAGECARFCESRRTARDKINRLVVAETGEHRILAGEVVVQAHIEFLLVQLPHRDTSEVEAGVRSGRAGE